MSREVGDSVKVAYLYATTAELLALLAFAFAATLLENWWIVGVSASLFVIHSHLSSKRWVMWAGELDD